MAKPQPWRLIANPAAARGRARHIAGVASENLRKRGISIELIETEAPGHAGELARGAVAQGAERIVVCGGDGTIHEVLPTLAGSEAALGLLPFGTANDFARSLGIPRKLQPAVETLITGKEALVDLGMENDRYFCTVAAFGFDAEVSQAMEDGLVPLSGTVGYLYAAIQHIVNFDPPRTRIAGDFGTAEGEMLLVAAAVTRSYGGGMQIAPHADPADGKFDVVIVDAVDKLTMVTILPQVFWGGHVRHPAVRVERTASLSIETDGIARLLHADGEPLTTTPAHMRIAPNSLRVVVPRGANFRSSREAL